MIKKLLLACVITVFIIVIIFFYRHELYSSLPLNIKSIFKIVLSNEINTKRLNNDYNTKFLPKTQFINVDFSKKKLEVDIGKNTSGYANFLAKKTISFYIDIYKNNIFLLFNDGRIYSGNLDLMGSNKFDLNQIKNNINLISPLDLYIKDNYIYISGSKKIKKNCNYFVILKGNINLKKIIFEEIFSSQKCYNLIQSGRIQYLNDYKKLLVSTAADILKNEDQSDEKPQNENSIMGKTILVDENDGSYEIFTKGHRNIIGLYANEQTILATENGPRGGDEINLLLKGRNYGWPISSYGEKYKTLDEENVHYKKNHELYGYMEPIFSFVPSIGISEIISIDNQFSKHWTDNYLIASLNSRHLYRVKFDPNFLKVIFLEKIYIGERIRDLKYYNKKNIIILSLEETGSIGILTTKNYD